MNNRNIIGTIVTEALADPAFQLQLAEALSNRLQQRLAGESLYIPKKTCDQRATRNAQIRQALDAGTPFDELQVTHRVSKRTLYRLKNH